ncbi:Dor1-domain-containing protein [Rhizoclosmatium globosum]|uniref:Conserved oligomeric Golgi complex subunit 8 n=1 Tax=Rhizoclosmatium globosum TaxID=329046 RepID=A0A1Y2CUT2_9FUNG|nr:Dor1-domain-containing protein [Rhizoclosmatium globosum]|eukprot:ORY50075.1 Dor1-domain-containing protein [Rhizoclosmatium globosum]
MGLPQLKALPSALAAEQRGIDAALSGLAAAEHRSFLAANACQRDLAVRADAVAASLDGLALKAEALSLNLKLDPIDQSQKDKERILRNNYDQIIDLLGIPSLFDAFVRAGAYEDALDLAAFVSRLTLRHPSSAAVQSISSQVSTSTTLMLAQLVATLKSNAKLPQCIRVIGYLRRMEVFPETELRLVFLQQKDAFFRQLLSEIRETDPSEHVKKYIEVSREHFFDIITQYKAIFADSNLPSSTSTLLHSNSLHHNSQTATTPAIYHPQTSALATSTILSSYVTQTVNLFLEALTQSLPHIHDTQSLSSLLTQTMYYGLSLGRVGVDFRILTTDPFLTATERIATTLLDEGCAGFHNWLSTTTPVAQGIYMKQFTASSTTVPSRQNSFPPSSAASAANIISPPQQLLAYPPLAHLLNVFYTCYNALRVVPATALAPRLRLVISGHISKVVAVLQNAATAIESEVGGTEAEVEESQRYRDFCSACKLFVEVLVPSIWDGFERWEMKVVLEEKRQKAAAAAAVAAALKAEEDKAAAVVAESAVNAGVEEAVNSEQTKSVEPVVDQANALVEQPLEEKQQSRGASLDQRRQQSPVRQSLDTKKE